MDTDEKITENRMGFVTSFLSLFRGAKAYLTNNLIKKFASFLGDSAKINL